MFSLLHICSMVLSAILMWGFTKYVLLGGLERAEKWLKFIAVLALLLDPIYWVWEYHTYGRFDFASTLPLFLCSLFWMMLPIGMFLRPGFLKQMALANVATIGLVTGILGFVFNTHLNHFGFFTFIPMRSLFYHFLMMFGAVLLWTSGYYKPRAGDQWRGFLPVLGLLIPGYILNRLYGYDYGYMNGGLGTPIEILSRVMPKALFLLVLYGGLFLVLWGMFYRRLPIRNKV